jgi:hypothetical protein
MSILLHAALILGLAKVGGSDIHLRSIVYGFFFLFFLFF